MTVQKAIDIFELLLDKYASPNVEDDEILDYFNLAINEVLNRIFPDNEGSVINFEFDSNVLSNIQPLIFNLTGLSMNGSGIVTDTVINSALVTASGQSDAEYFRIGSIGFGSYPCKYMKTNNRWSYQRNVFKQPTATNPRFSLIASGLQIYPTSPTTSLTINVVKKPKVLTSANLSDPCELGDYEMYNVIALAVKAAGVGIRDGELLEDVRMSALQIAQ